jgi:uncharacterized protein YbjT (DUF2867 family)
VKVLVIGGTSGIGKRTVEAALSRDMDVRAMARDVSGMSERPGLEPFAGDAIEPDDVDRALDGVDAVVQALGIGPAPKPWQRVRLFSRSTDVLVPAMQARGIARLVAVTGFGTGDSKTALSALERLGQSALLGNAYRDKERQEMTITASGLEWTLVRPTLLTNSAKSGRYRVLTAGNWRNGMISRADVADFIVTALADRSYVGQAVVLAR